METKLYEMVGMVGSTILCVSAIPQIVRTYRSRQSEGLSGAYLAILCVGMTLILLYAVHVKDIVFIVGNSFSLFFTGILTGLWFRYRKP